jgi:hypothetical protein
MNIAYFVAFPLAFVRSLQSRRSWRPMSRSDSSS